MRNGKFPKLIFTLMIINVLIFSITLKAVETKQVEVTGAAYIEGDNLVKARKEAINDGLRRGVEQVVGLYINAQTKTNNYQLINDNILKSSQGYIKSYQIIDQYIEGKNYYVKLEIIVGTNDLSKDLTALKLNIKRHGNPRIMVLISQTEGDINLDNSIAQTEMISQFLKSGYQVIDSKRIKEVVNQEKRNTILAGDLISAAKLGDQLTADLVVVGKATASYINLNQHLQDNSLSGLASYHSQLEATVIKASTAEVITAVTTTAKGVGANKEAAANKAILTGSKKIVTELISQLSEEVIQAEKTINLKIVGIDSLGQLVRLKRQIPLLSGVKQVYFREYNNGLASFDLDLINTTKTLELALELQSLANFKFKIKRLSENKLSLEVQN